MYSMRLVRRLSNKIILIFVLLLPLKASAAVDCRLVSAIANAIHSSYYPDHRLDITNIIDDTYRKLGLKNDINNPPQTQTLAYLSNHSLYENLNIHFNYKINTMGINFFKELFSEIIEREIELKDDYYVFYHGQKREFALPQDIYQGLYEIVYKKVLHNFVMLRFPDKDFSKFGSIKNFLEKYIKNGELKNYSIWFDTQPHIKNHLLSVNSALFGNTSFDWGGECTFAYFINSTSATTVDVIDLVSKAFQLFKMNKYFNKYRESINELNNLLGEWENGKTGLLLQIFVPQEITDDVAYQCAPGGFLYYDDEYSIADHPASKDLEMYKNSMFLESGWRLDAMQFRLLMNKKMLDSTSGVKIFRYCNETPKFTEYKMKLKNLLNNIEQEYKIAPIESPGFLKKIYKWVKI